MCWLRKSYSQKTSIGATTMSKKRTFFLTGFKKRITKYLFFLLRLRKKIIRQSLNNSKISNLQNVNNPNNPNNNNNTN